MRCAQSSLQGFGVLCVELKVLCVMHNSVIHKVPYTLRKDNVLAHTNDHHSSYTPFTEGTLVHSTVEKVSVRVKLPQV